MADVGIESAGSGNLRQGRAANGSQSKALGNPRRSNTASDIRRTALNDIAQHFHHVWDDGAAVKHRSGGVGSAHVLPRGRIPSLLRG